MNREARAVDRELTALGFELVRDRRHLVYRHPSGGPQLAVPKTPSDHRATRNSIAQARRIVKGFR